MGVSKNGEPQNRSLYKTTGLIKATPNKGPLFISNLHMPGCPQQKVFSTVSSALPTIQDEAHILLVLETLHDLM